jgi:hypothetical protein
MVAVEPLVPEKRTRTVASAGCASFALFSSSPAATMHPRTMMLIPSNPKVAVLEMSLY